MSKRKRKRRHSPPSEQGPRSHALPRVPTSPHEFPGVPTSSPPTSSAADDLPAALEQADGLIARGRARQAVELLEPFLETCPSVADLHYYLGYARVKSGDVWSGVGEYERAMELSRDPTYWLPIASLYLNVELRAHALRAFRQVLRRPADLPEADVENARTWVAALEEAVGELAHSLRLSVRQAEEGLWHMEEGQRALDRGDYPACIAANQRAIKLLRDWPPPLNNLSLALFFGGQPEKAIATARRVLAHAPDNVQALSNAIRFLAWTGQEAEARALWERLKAIPPADPSGRIKMAEAAAILGEDESVYQLLRPLDKPGAAEQGEPSGWSPHMQLFLAVAEANTGRLQAAQHRLRMLQRDVRAAGEFLAALKAGRPGPGWAERFPYFRSTDLLSRSEMGKFVELVQREDDLSPARFREQVARFVARFPQVVLMAEKMIWEDGEPQAGIGILSTVATPAAYTALRRFGLSQAGEDEVRMQALSRLMEAGEIAQDATLRVWAGGEWRTVQLRQQVISDEPQTHYAPQVASLLDQGLLAFKQGDYQQAEQLFRRALELEPRAKEAYNNLGAIYARRGDHTRAKETYQAALEIDPLYTFPRCNLGLYLLDEGDVAGAEEMLRPLAGATRFHPQEVAFYSYAQARIAISRQEYEAARRALQAALTILPDYKPAKELLERLDVISQIRSGFESWAERQHRRDRAARARLQAKLTTPAPALAQALSVYTRDAFTGMARVVVPWGGWGALRKAELHERIAEALGAPDNLPRVVAGLTGDERAALRDVLAHGGAMDWQEFDDAYGNDLEESPYWQWHTPETAMGRLRQRGLLAEATVDGELLVAIPADLRPTLQTILEEEATS